jgi:uncharacterized protein YxeA
MRQLMQLLIIVAVIIAIVFFAKQMNQPAGYQKVHEETTTKTKYVKEPESSHHHTGTETYTKTVKPDKEGSQVTVKEQTKYSEK